MKFEIAAGIKRYFHTLTIRELNFFFFCKKLFHLLWSSNSFMIWLWIMRYLKCMHISLFKKQLDFLFHFNLHFISRISYSSHQTGMVHEKKRNYLLKVVLFIRILSSQKFMFLSSFNLYYFTFLFWLQRIYLQ